MRNRNMLAVCLGLLLVPACHKRSQINAGEDPVARTPQPGISPSGEKPIPLDNSEWKNGSPTELVGNWASSLFHDRRCTAFYTFSGEASAELNLVCFNAEKKQFEREFRRYSVAQYPGTRQIRFKQLESSCPANDSKSIKGEGVSFLYGLETLSDPSQPLRLELKEPSEDKTALSLSKSDGLMVDGFPGKTVNYLGMAVINGCFVDGLITNFQVAP